MLQIYHSIRKHCCGTDVSILGTDINIYKLNTISPGHFAHTHRSSNCAAARYQGGSYVGVISPFPYFSVYCKYRHDICYLTVLNVAFAGLHSLVELCFLVRYLLGFHLAGFLS